MTGIPGKWDVMKGPLRSVKDKYDYNPKVLNRGTTNINERLMANKTNRALAAQAAPFDQLKYGGMMFTEGVIAPQYQGFEDGTYGILGRPQPDEARWAGRAGAVRPGTWNGATTDVGLPMIPESFWNYVERKQNELILSTFDQWKLAQIPYNAKPEEMDYWRSRFPELVQRKFESLELELEIEKRVKKLNITGAANLDDMWFIYNLRNGINAETELTALSPPPRKLQNLFEANNVIQKEIRLGNQNVEMRLDQAPGAVNPTLLDHIEDGEGQVERWFTAANTDAETQVRNLKNYTQNNLATLQPERVSTEEERGNASASLDVSRAIYRDQRYLSRHIDAMKRSQTRREARRGAA